jgi:hypothetical protein
VFETEIKTKSEWEESNEGTLKAEEDRLKA